MLRISKITATCTLVLIHMVNDPDRIYSDSELAQALGLGQPTVSKVLKLLNQSNIVVSTRGAHGGYSLARPANEISIAHIIDALDDQPFGLTECFATAGYFDDVTANLNRRIWQQYCVIEILYHVVYCADVQHDT